MLHPTPTLPSPNPPATHKLPNMSHQTENQAGEKPGAEEAGNLSNCVVSTTALPESSESQGKIPLDFLLNPSWETTAKNDAQNRRENKGQDDRNGEPESIQHQGKSSSTKKGVVEPHIVSCPASELDLLSPRDVNAHEKAADTGSSQNSGADDDIICDTCFGVFKNARNLRVHKHIAHNGTPIAFCNRCAANFTSTRSFALHKRVHANERKDTGGVKKKGSTDHYCDHCNNSYLKGIVERHQRQRQTHRGRDPKGFRCMHDCGYVSESKLRRDEHEIFCPKAPHNQCDL